MKLTTLVEITRIRQEVSPNVSSRTMTVRYSSSVILFNTKNRVLASHPHTSGDPHPSREDIEVTERLIEVERIVGIQLLDHIIVGAGEEYVSLKAQGVL